VEVELVAQIAAQRIGEHLADHPGHLQRERRSDLSSPLEERIEKARCARVTLGSHGARDPDLEVGLAGPGGDDDATEGAGAVVEHEPERRQVIRAGVHHDVSGAEARRRECDAEPPEVLSFTLRIEDRAGRGEDPLQPAGVHRDQAAEWRFAGLTRWEAVPRDTGYEL